MKEIYLAGGCFWCISGVFLNTDGIIDVISGYSGGEEKAPTYEQVKSQQTGHRETIKIVYDGNKISENEILEIFFRSVDPYDYDGQFIDKGHSYTLAFYYRDIVEKALFNDFISKKQAILGKEIAIAVEEFKTFYKAEEYHQRFSETHKDEYEKELIESGRKK